MNTSHPRHAAPLTLDRAGDQTAAKPQPGLRPGEPGLDAGTTTTPAATQPAAAPVRRHRSWARRLAGSPRPLLLGGLALTLALIGIVAWRVFDVQVGDNFAEVVPGTLYRSAQLTPDALADRIDQNGIASVINLRGIQRDHAWYRDEARVCKDRQVPLYDLHMSATMYPDPATLERLMEILRTAPRPMLVHCRSGADRTGLACALFELNAHPQRAATAARALTLWHGHVPIGPNGAMDRFLTLYGSAAAGLPIEQWAHWCYPALYRAAQRPSPTLKLDSPIRPPADTDPHQHS